MRRAGIVDNSILYKWAKAVCRYGSASIVFRTAASIAASFSKRMKVGVDNSQVRKILAAVYRDCKGNIWQVATVSVSVILMCHLLFDGLLYGSYRPVPIAILIVFISAVYFSGKGAARRAMAIWKGSVVFSLLHKRL